MLTNDVVRTNLLADAGGRQWYHFRILEWIVPTASLHLAWLEAHREWGSGQHEDGFGLAEEDDTETAGGFVKWIGRLLDQSNSTASVDFRQAHCSYRWIVDGTELLGRIALRHEFTDFVARMGHVGYGIRPPGRGRGVATWALRQILDEARAIGLERVLIVCAADNLASARVIEITAGSSMTYRRMVFFSAATGSGRGCIDELF